MYGLQADGEHRSCKSFPAAGLPPSSAAAAVAEGALSSSGCAASALGVTVAAAAAAAAFLCAWRRSTIRCAIDANGRTAAMALCSNDAVKEGRHGVGDQGGRKLTNIISTISHQNITNVENHGLWKNLSWPPTAGTAVSYCTCD